MENHASSRRRLNRRRRRRHRRRRVIVGTLIQVEHELLLVLHQKLSGTFDIHKQSINPFDVLLRNLTSLPALTHKTGRHDHSIA